MIRWFAWGVLALVAAPSAAQVCRLSVAGLNRERKVLGDVSTECPAPLHTVPFGNWGVTSNFGQKRDGHQFQGWCRETRVCDNNGECKVDCRDGWYEWNSCTTNARYRPPNCTLYNADECTTQVSSEGINVHGTQTVEIPVRCPIDTNNDGVADEGGCADVKSYSHGTNFMSLYEQDPLTPDQLVQTLYFPASPVSLRCTVAGCPPTGSEWVKAERWDSPAAPVRVLAEMATVVNSGTFADPRGACRVLVTVATTVSAASFAPLVSPASIATVFGSNLASGTATADRQPRVDLAGSRVFLTDSLGARRQAELFYASPRQINFVVPPGIERGTASLAVESDAGLRAVGTVRVEPVAPAIFMAGSAPAAFVVRNTAQGQVSQLASEVIDLRGAAGDVVLVLYGTGLRARANDAEVKVAGEGMRVLYSGPQPEFAGLDQVNAVLAPSLAGKGEVTLQVWVGGVEANRSVLRFR